LYASGFQHAARLEAGTAGETASSGIFMNSNSWDFFNFGYLGFVSSFVFHASDLLTDAHRFAMVEIFEG
jgi:hypothetical protein